MSPGLVLQFLGLPQVRLDNSATGFGALTNAFMLANRVRHRRRGKLLVFTNIAFPLILIAFAFISAFWLSLLLAYCHDAVRRLLPASFAPCTNAHPGSTKTSLRKNL